MLRSVFVGVSRHILIAGFAAMAVVVSIASPSFAASTQVNSTVCSGNSSNASLTIDSPLSDSVVSQLPLTVTGTIGSVTQVDISIDGQYNSTVPVSVNQATFTTTLQLVQGTHTITFEANDVCQFQNVTQTLIVTYQPTVSPNQGPVAPIIPTDTTSPTTQDTPASGSADAGANPLQNIPIVGALVPIANSIARALDFDVSAKQGGLWAAMARFAFFTLGIGLAFFGAGVVHALRKRALRDTAVEGYIRGANLQDPELNVHIHRNIMFVRCTGALLLCFSFLI